MLEQGVIFLSSVSIIVLTGALNAHVAVIRTWTA